MCLCYWGGQAVEFVLHFGGLYHHLNNSQLDIGNCMICYYTYFFIATENTSSSSLSGVMSLICTRYTSCFSRDISLQSLTERSMSSQTDVSPSALPVHLDYIDKDIVSDTSNSAADSPCQNHVTFSENTHALQVEEDSKVIPAEGPASQETLPLQSSLPDQHDSHSHGEQPEEKLACVEVESGAFLSKESSLVPPSSLQTVTFGNVPADSLPKVEESIGYPLPSSLFSASCLLVLIWRILGKHPFKKYLPKMFLLGNEG